jgi:hypothetical protein
MVRLGLVTTDEALKGFLEEGLRRDPNVAAITDFPDAAALPASELALCRSAACGPRHPTVCSWAREQGLDYFAVASVETDGYTMRSTTRAGSYEARARFWLEVSDVATCTKIDQVSRTLKETTNTRPEEGEGGGGGLTLARQRLMESIAASLGDTFPLQMVVDEASHLRRTGAELPTPDGLYGVFRQDEYIGLVDVAAAETPAERITRLGCCFQPRPGDLLVQRDRYHLLELAPSALFATMTVDDHTRLAAGAGVHARYWPVTSGWQGGVAIDFLFATGARAVLGTVEAGYRWRPASAMTVALVGGAGGGFGSSATADAAGEAQARGVHVIGGVNANVQPARNVFADVDLGFIYSNHYGDVAPGTQPQLTLRGPILRLAVGLR